MPILPTSSIRTSRSPERNAAALLSLRYGSQNYTLSQLLSALLGGDTGNTVWRVLVHVRIPRTLAALLAGAALALAGALIQAVLNNAMASPNIIGVNAGAGFFALLAAALFPGAAGLTPLASFLGALLTALFIYLLASRAGLSRTSLILAGLAVSFCGLLGFVGLLVPHMARRLMGGDNRWLFPAAALLGGAFVLVCDVLARVLFAPFELPVGIVMSLLGGPFFLHLLLRHKRSRIYA